MNFNAPIVRSLTGKSSAKPIHIWGEIENPNTTFIPHVGFRYAQPNLQVEIVATLPPLLFSIFRSLTEKSSVQPLDEQRQALAGERPGTLE